MAKPNNPRTAKAPLATLSRRERQMMDILLTRGSATAAEVHSDLPDPPSYSAVRATLRLLEDKGHARHTKDGRRYVYEPVRSPKRMRRGAVEHLLRTFFSGSRTDAVSALMEARDFRISDDEYDELTALLEKARQRSKGETR